MVSHQERLTALTEAALGGSSLTMKSKLAVTTTNSPASRSTQSITRSYKRALTVVLELRYTSTPIRVLSARLS